MSQTIQAARSRPGFTLVELLVVIAVLMILMGLVLPAIVQSKRRALDTVDISNLRQIGQARALYEEANGSLYETASLMDAGLLPKELLSSPSDWTREGLANRYRRIDTDTVRLIRPYRDSYLPIGDLVGAGPIQKLMETKGAGWLVSIGQSQGKDPRYPLTSGLIGPYLRLRYDGGVVRRRHKWKDTTDVDGSPATMTSTHWMYTDDQETKP